jgi:hypothetical protein
MYELEVMAWRSALKRLRLKRIPRMKKKTKTMPIIHNLGF